MKNLWLLGLAAMVAAPLGIAQDEPKRDPPKKELKVVEDDLKAGVCAEYYFIGTEIKKVADAVAADRKPDVCRVDTTINFEAKDGQGFKDLQGREFFAVIWTGTLRVPVTGKVTFYLKSDDGSRFFLDGKELINNDGKHRMDEDSATQDLTAGDHEFRIEYFQNKDKAGCVLSWKYDGVEKHVVPPTAFWHKFNKTIDSETK